MLVRTPTPFPTESLMGFILRITTANGYDSPWHVMQLAGLSQSEMKTAGFPVAKLAAVLGRDANSLDHIAYQHGAPDGAGTFSILGHSLGGTLGYEPLRLSKPGICLQCIAETGYQDAYFDLHLAVACPVHKTTLVTQCPSCDKPLTIFRPALTTCKCGSTLLEAPTREVSQDLVDLMAVLYAILHNVPASDQLLTSRLPVAQLMATPLRSLLLKLPEFGAMLGMPSADPLGSMEVAAAALGNWPHGFVSYVENLLSAQSVIQSRRRALRFHNAFFTSEICGTDFEWLRVAFLRCGLESEQDCLGEQLHFARHAAGRWVSDAVLARQLGVNQSELAQLNERRLAASALDAVLKRHDVPAEDPVGNVQAVKGDDFQSLRQAAEYLRMPVRVVRQLIDDGHLPLPRARSTARETTRGRSAGIHVTDLDEFHERLMAACPVAASAVADIVSLEQVLSEYRFHNHAGKAQFVVDYLAGNLVAIGRTAEAAAHIQFTKADVAAYVAASRAAAAGGTITVREASTLIGCDPQAIPVLLSQGQLIAVQGREGQRVTRLSVEYFAQKFAVIGAVAKSLQSSSNRLIRLSAKAGIPLLLIPRVSASGGDIPFIERVNLADLLQFELQHPNLRRPQVKSSESTEPKVVVALRDYLTQLDERGAELPRRAGLPNKKAIAEACGFDRNVLYNNAAAMGLVATYAANEPAMRSIA